MSCEKVVKDYAKYKIKMIEENVENYDIRESAIKHINKVCTLIEKGYITVDEAIKAILNSTDEGWE